MSLLEVRGLDIFFKTRPVKVVNDLSFCLEQGMVFGLVGESGCGKSLTALSIMGILPENFHAKGFINLKGKNLIGLPDKDLQAIRGKDISIIFQEPMTSLNPVLRVGYQIKEAILAHLNVSKKQADEMTVDLLRAVKIPSPEIRMKEYPHQLSGGMRQRVMIAMAISCSPSILIADEPTTALDVTIEAEILELLRGIMEMKNMSVLLITHDLGIIRENANAVAIMYAGRLMETAAVEEIFASPMHPYTMGLIESLPQKRGQALKPIRGSVPRPDSLPEGCKFSDRCRFMMPYCQTDEPPLSEISHGHKVRCIRTREIKWQS